MTMIPGTRLLNSQSINLTYRLPILKEIHFMVYTVVFRIEFNFVRWV
ncbi:MAG TPA: hypothetical protein VFQ91_18215 [Bryobacteraceae bacterium]|nr:hypothetical protein [Bryobacteraceae bacterium]